MTTTSSPPVLELRGIDKRFGAVQALSGVDFEAHAGEIVALVGDNGAGKSTLVKVMSGVGPPTAGDVLFEGRSVNINRPADSVGLGIATVYQDLALCDNLDVVANLFLGDEGRTKLLGRIGWIDEVAMEQKALDLLRELSVRIPTVRVPVASLSGGQRQSIAIARSLLGAPKVVILDEPTAALGVAQTAQVLDLVVRLRERGLAVVMISHNLADVFAVADKVQVLRLGRDAGRFSVADTDEDAIVAAITGAAGGKGRRAGLPDTATLSAPADQTAPQGGTP
ncbi:MAG: transporter related [Mycobacterium sp.]|nr:transporter related [Mycobacterium sp.]